MLTFCIYTVSFLFSPKTAQYDDDDDIPSQQTGRKNFSSLALSQQRKKCLIQNLKPIVPLSREE